MRVNAEWSCSEFIEKVSAMAKMVFPALDINDEIHITESWNYYRTQHYESSVREEHTPIPFSRQNIGERYPTEYFQPLHFYIYYSRECPAFCRLISETGNTQTTEQCDVGCDYYYDLWVHDLEEQNQIIRNRRSIIIPPQDSYDLSYESQPTNLSLLEPSRLTGESTNNYFNSIVNIVSPSSQAVSIDDLIIQPDPIYDDDVVRNLNNEFTNELNNPSNSYYNNDVEDNGFHFNFYNEV
jgi:hypothetical protein